MQEELLRLQAAAMVQAADVSALLEMLLQFETALRKDYPELPKVGPAFLQRRKELVQQQLEDLERNNPALAAQISKMIDDSATLFPFRYD